MHKIIVDHNANDADKKVIREGIFAFNKGILGRGMLEKTFSVLLKDESNNIHGGILAYFDSESVFIDILWVDENSRHQGHGSKLLRAAENEACKLGCRYSTLDTWSFQAEEFYLKNGYERLGEIKNYYLHHSKIFLRKKLEGLSA